MKLAIANLIAATVFAGAASPSTAQIARVDVTGGPIAGAVADGLSVFKGIPFAAPPTGDRRWKAPQPLQPWGPEQRQATAFAPACIQDEGRARRAAPDVSLSEDCLYLNVWTPAKAATDKLPVIAWLHGGDFNEGMTSAPVFDGAGLARKGVVFVSIAYRVGPFGFLATPELSQESDHGSGNYGLLDQIAALEWIKANIANFGGDPSKVTLMGQSAGSFSASILVGSPRAAHLFRRVIAEGGANFMPPQGSPWVGAAIQTLGPAEDAGKAWLKQIGVTTLSEARALPAEKLEAAHRAPNSPRFWPVLDGYVVVSDQYRLWFEGRFNDAFILLGMVSAKAGTSTIRKTDAAAFESEVRQRYGAHAENILSVYPHDTDEQATQSTVELQIDSNVNWGSFTWARLQPLRGGIIGYVYYFDRLPAATADESIVGPEDPYVFGNFDLRGRPPAIKENRALAELMQTYWVNFATGGNPNGPDLLVWPTFSDAHRTVMRFGFNPGQAALPNPERLEVLDRYYEWRREGSK